MGAARLGRGGCWRVVALLAATFGAISCGEVGTDGPASGSSAGGKADAGGEPTGGVGQAGSAGESAAGAGGDTVVNSSDHGPSDTRPPRPAWSPTFPLGTPGWRSSTTPICDPSQGRFSAFGVWADQRGVFSVVAHDCGNDGEGSTRGDCTKSGLSLQFNAGSGWQDVFLSGPDMSGFDFSVEQLTGFPGGPILDVGQLQGQSGLFSIDHGLATAPGPDVTVPNRVFVVDANTAYGVAGTGVYQYASGAWLKLTDVPNQVESVWADGSRIVVAGPDSAVYQSATRSIAFATVPEAPIGYHGSLWGLGNSDIWTDYGDSQLAHYDGSQWTIVDVSSVGRVAQLWGIDSVLFVSATNSLGRLSNGQLDVLLPPPAAPNGLQITGLWGRSATDVFVAFNEESYEQYACGGDFMVWFDGSQLHSF